MCRHTLTHANWGKYNSNYSVVYPVHANEGQCTLVQEVEEYKSTYLEDTQGQGIMSQTIFCSTPNANRYWDCVTMAICQ